MEKVPLPSGLQNLISGDRDSLEKLPLPSDQQNSTFGDRSLEKVSLPSGLQNLTSGDIHPWSKSVDALSGLQNLTSGDNHSRSKNADVLRESLEKMTLSSGLQKLTTMEHINDRMETAVLVQSAAGTDLANIPTLQSNRGVPFQSLAEAIDRVAHVAPARLAAIDDTEETITYKDLVENSTHVAEVLLRHGMRPLSERPLATLMRRGCKWLILYNASIRCGVPMLALSNDLRADRAAESQRNVGAIRELLPQCFVYESVCALGFNYNEALKVARNNQAVVLTLAELTSLAQSASTGSSNSLSAIEVGPQALLGYVYTGGTTKASKVVKITHAMALHEFHQYYTIFPESLRGSTMRFLQNSSPYWGAALLGQVDVAWAMEGTLVMVEASLPSDIVETIRKFEVTAFGAVPSVLAHVTPADVPSVQCVIAWAEDLPDATAARWQRDVHLLDLLIASEYWLAFYSVRSQGQGRALSLINGVDIILLDAESLEVVTSSRLMGELCITGNTVSPGYVNSCDNEGKFLEIGGQRYFRTSDLAYWVEPGKTFQYCGRCGDMAKVGGKWVDLSAIESSLQSLPAVSEAKLMFAANQRDAFVVLRREANSTTSFSHLLDSIRSMLPTETITHIVSAKELPRHSATGKVNRQTLAKALQIGDLDKIVVPRRARLYSRFLRMLRCASEFCHRDPRRMLCLAYIWYGFYFCRDFDKMRKKLEETFPLIGGDRGCMLAMAWSLPLRQLQRLAAPGAAHAEKSWRSLHWIIIFWAALPSFFASAPPSSPAKLPPWVYSTEQTVERLLREWQVSCSKWKNTACPTCHENVSLYPSLTHCCERCPRTGGQEHDVHCTARRSKCKNCSFRTTWHHVYCCHACEKEPGQHGPRCDRIPYRNGATENHGNSEEQQDIEMIAAESEHGDKKRKSSEALGSLSKERPPKQKAAGNGLIQERRIGEMWSTSGLSMERLESEKVAAWGAGNIDKIWSTVNFAFVARLKNGEIAAWGDSCRGGDISGVKAELEAGGIDQIWSTGGGAFVATLNNGKVAAWGDSFSGGDITGVRAALEAGGIDRIWPAYFAFLARLKNGQVVAWGDSRFGGDLAEVQSELEEGGIDEAWSTGEAFFVRLKNGKVAAWGDSRFGGDISEIKDELEAGGIDTIWSTGGGAFVSRLKNGKVVAWGDSRSGGDIAAVQAELEAGGIDEIWSTSSAFVAKLKNGKVTAWGDSRFGGDIALVKTELEAGGIDQIWSTYWAFVARMRNGKVAAWGDSHSGGDIAGVKGELEAGIIDQIWCASSGAFVAKLKNRQVAAWGNPRFGGDIAEVRAELEAVGIDEIWSTSNAFVARLKNGEVAAWGNSGHNGGIAQVKNEIEAIDDMQISLGDRDSEIADESMNSSGFPLDDASVAQLLQRVGGIGDGDRLMLDSLRSLRLLSAIRDEFGRALTFKQLNACSTVPDLVELIETTPALDSQKRQFPDPGNKGFRIWTFGWKNGLQWAFHCKSIPSMKSLRLAVGRTMQRQAALRLRHWEGLDMQTRFMEAACTLDAWRSVKGLQPLLLRLSVALKECWPRWYTPPVEDCLLDNVILNQECAVSDIGKVMRQLKSHFEPPFQIAVLRHPESSVSEGHIVVMLSHAIADASAVVPFLNSFVSEIQREGADGAQHRLPPLPHFGAILEDRLVRTLDDESQFEDIMFLDRRMDFFQHHFQGESSKRGWIQSFPVPAEEVNEICRIARSIVAGCTIEIAFLSLIVISLARINGESHVKFTIVHHGRDNPTGASDVVGFFTDFRTLEVPTSGLTSLLGVLNFIAVAVRERRWRRPVVLEPIDTLINIVPSPYSQVGDFAQAHFGGQDRSEAFWQDKRMMKTYRRPLEFQIEQIDSNEWYFTMYLDKAEYSFEKGERFRKAWQLALKQLRDDPLQGVLQRAGQSVLDFD